MKQSRWNVNICNFEEMNGQIIHQCILLAIFIHFIIACLKKNEATVAKVIGTHKKQSTLFLYNK